MGNLAMRWLLVFAVWVGVVVAYVPKPGCEVIAEIKTGPNTTRFDVSCVREPEVRYWPALDITVTMQGTLDYYVQETLVRRVPLHEHLFQDSPRCFPK